MNYDKLKSAAQKNMNGEKLKSAAQVAIKMLLKIGRQYLRIFVFKQAMAMILPVIVPTALIGVFQAIISSFSKQDTIS